MHQVVDSLNDKIESVVTSLKQDSSYTYRLGFFPPTTPDNPFENHTICDTVPYFNPVVLSSTEHSFHPNELGQNAYYEYLEEVINN